MMWIIFLNPELSYSRVWLNASFDSVDKFQLNKVKTWRQSSKHK